MWPYGPDDLIPNWLLICDRVRRGRVSDGGAVYDQFDAAITLASVSGIIRRNRLRFSKAARGDRRSPNSLLCEKIADGIRAALGKLLVVFIGAHTVRVAFDLQSEARMREQNA